jgi:ribonuclease BN (tRNA processing enzyme)
MAYITKLGVPDETTKFMNGLGFYQSETVSPNVEWNNLKGLSISHHHQDYPRTLDDVLNMVYVAGFNTGVYEQAEQFKQRGQDLVAKFVYDHRVISKISRRADSNLLLQGLNG